MKSLWRVAQLGRSGRGRMAMAVLLGTLAAGASVALAGVSAWLIARAAERPPVLHLMVAIVAVRTFGIGRGVLRYAERLVAHDASFRVLTDLRVAVVRRWARLSPGGTGSLGHGDLLARFVGDVDGLADLWVRVLLPTAVTVLVTLGAIGMLVALLPAAGLVLAVSATVAMLVAPAMAVRFSSRAAARLAPARGEYQQQLLTVLDGAAELSLYGALDQELSRLRAIDERVRAAETRSAWGAGLGSALGMVALGAGLVAGLLVAASAIADGRLDGPGLAVTVLLPLAVHELIALLTPAATQLPQLAASARRLLEVLDAPDVVDEPVAPTPLPTGPFSLQLRGLDVGWPGSDVLLRDLTLDVAAGEHVALVGDSGLGKSTLAATLMRFLPPKSGTITLVGSDGSVPLSELAEADLRRAMSWCAQDAHVFDSTLAANVRFARPSADDQELGDAIATAQLSEWVAARPGGLDAMVGEHGDTMSGGERQRLALARVVLSQAPVVVLDEPTEHLDDLLARTILGDMLGALAGRTVLLVTHRRDLLPPDMRVIDLGA